MTSFHYVKGALQFLVPILLVTLAKQVCRATHWSSHMIDHVIGHVIVGGA